MLLSTSSGPMRSSIPSKSTISLPLSSILVVPWSSLALVGPRFEPPLAVASYPFPADEGRGVEVLRLCKRLSDQARSNDLTVFSHQASVRLLREETSEVPVIAAGYRRPVKIVRAIIKRDPGKSSLIMSLLLLCEVKRCEDSVDKPNPRERWTIPPKP